MSNIDMKRRIEKYGIEAVARVPTAARRQASEHPPALAKTAPFRCKPGTHKKRRQRD
ncbi:hypothetical protein [Burkholderia ubonensis]|uniref:hypothetical protein n=1 Tax=Burkholderia ubonensis TaxID=101571 RepID=UPI0012FCBF2C|nr:hypothetical protein [Burkholderia ubonensis]